MADEFEVSTKGVIPSDVITMIHAGIAADKVGAAVKFSANDTVALCGDGDRVDGILLEIATGTTCAVQVRGTVDVPYSGTAPSVGISALVSDADGKLKVEGSPGVVQLSSGFERKTPTTQSCGVIL